MPIKENGLTGIASCSDREETEVNPHKGVCMWCKKVYREGIEPISHGYCGEECRDAHLKWAMG